MVSEKATWGLINELGKTHRSARVHRRRMAREHAKRVRLYRRYRDHLQAWRMSASERERFRRLCSGKPLRVVDTLGMPFLVELAFTAPRVVKLGQHGYES